LLPNHPVSLLAVELLLLCCAEVENIFKIIEYNYINGNKLGMKSTSQLWHVQSSTVPRFQFMSANI
jgi:hypothetical protein